MSEAFAQLRSYLREASGISLDATKAFHVDARLAPLMRSAGLPDLEALVQRMQRGDAELARQTIEAMTTGETFFFRDRQPFAAFRETILPALLESRAAQRSLRIWCAACSSGQEPYSIAMILDEHSRQLSGWRVELLASDISRAAIDQARRGEYNQFEVQRGLPVDYLLRYFQREGERWRVSEFLRSRVEFREINLRSEFAGLGRFDVIFARNVLLYFDDDLKTSMLKRLAAQCDANGYLILGAAETVLGLSDVWRSDEVWPTIYRPSLGRASKATA